MARVVSDAELVAAAKAGDRAAAGAFFARHLEYLGVMSRRVASSPDRAEDLLAGAITRLLELWRRGDGPDENVLTYLVSSMRNWVIDESRSPRAREVFVEELPEAPLAVLPDLRRVDLVREAALVRAAFARLSGDSQHAILEVVVNGRPPREVGPELGRSPGALSTLVTRAKAALRRELLVVILREGRAECAENAEALPSRVLDTPDAHPSGAPGIAHVLTCAECLANWGRFATLTSALGLVPVLSLGLTLGSPAPGAAAAAGGASRDGNGVDSSPDGRHVAPTPAPAAPIAPSGSPAVAGGLAASAPVGVVARVGRRARSVVVGPVGFAVTVVAVIGGAGMLVAALLGATGVVALPGSVVVPVAAEDAPTAHLRTSVTPNPDGSIELDVAFEVEADDWSLTSFAIALPPGVRIAAASGGWSCAASDGGGDCSLSGAVPVGSRFTLSADGGMPEDGEYLVQLEALAEGVTTVGYSRGPLPATEQTATPTPAS